MNKQQLKQRLHKEIDAIEDENALHMLNEAAVEYIRSKSNDILDELSPDQLKEFKESIQQLDNGQSFSHEEVKRYIKSVFISHDFSAVEDDENADEIIRDIAATAGKNAAAEARAAGLPLVFARNNELIEVSADGKESILQPVGSALPPFYVKYKPFTVFHARKK